MGLKVKFSFRNPCPGSLLSWDLFKDALLLQETGATFLFSWLPRKLTSSMYVLRFIYFYFILCVGCQPPGSGVKDASYHVDSGNQTCKSSKCFYFPSHPSSPWSGFLFGAPSSLSLLANVGQRLESWFLTTGIWSMELKAGAGLEAVRRREQL